MQQPNILFVSHTTTLFHLLAKWTARETRRVLHILPNDLETYVKKLQPFFTYSVAALVDVVNPKYACHIALELVSKIPDTRN